MFKCYEMLHKISLILKPVTSLGNTHGLNTKQINYKELTKNG